MYSNAKKFLKSNVSTMIGASYLVSGTAWLRFEEQGLMSVQTAAFSRLVKVILSALQLFAAGRGTV